LLCAASGATTGTSLVHLAAASGDILALQQALRLGGSLTTLDAQGRQPLHCAAMACSIDAVRFLVRNGGVDANAKAKQVRDGGGASHTHLHCCLRFVSTSCARLSWMLLLRAGPRCIEPPCMALSSCAKCWCRTVGRCWRCWMRRATPPSTPPCSGASAVPQRTCCLVVPTLVPSTM
jgi:hypothetical protein